MWPRSFLRRSALRLTLLGAAPATVIARDAFEPAEASAAPPPGQPIETFPVEQQRVLQFFPGLLPKPVMTMIGIAPAEAGLVPVGDGHFLIPPAYRDTDAASLPTTALQVAAFRLVAGRCAARSSRARRALRRCCAICRAVTARCKPWDACTHGWAAGMKS